MSKIVFIDTETTGLNRDALPWEVAAIEYDTEDRTIKEHLWYLFVPSGAMTKEAAEISRFEERYPKSPSDWTVGVTFGREFLALFEEPGTHWAGACPWFDERILMNVLRPWHGLDYDHTPWHYHLIDVENLMLGFLTLNRFGQSHGDFDRVDLPWKSRQLSEELGLPPIDPDTHHTALGDARWALDVWRAVNGLPVPS